MGWAPAAGYGVPRSPTSRAMRYEWKYDQPTEEVASMGLSLVPVLLDVRDGIPVVANHSVCQD